MLNFNFWEKGLGLVSPPHSAYDFSRKMFFMLPPINWPNFIVRLRLLLEILCNMCITIVCQRGCDVIKFESNLIFRIKSFFYMNKMLRQKLKYLENEKSFLDEIKTFFINFRGLSVAKNCLRPDSATLILGEIKEYLLSDKNPRLLWNLWYNQQNIVAILIFIIDLKSLMRRNFIFSC